MNFSHGSPLRATVLGLFNGNYAVDMFFVLSGFVLQNMLTGAGFIHQLAYWVRRLIRIYPLLWVSLLAGAISVGMFDRIAWMHGSPALSTWVDDLLRLPRGPVGIIRDFIPVDYNLNPVVWTIRIEIEASLIYPFVFLLWNRYAGAGKLVLLAATILLSMACREGVAHYLYMFVVGLGIKDLENSRTSRSGAIKLLGLALGLLLVAGFRERGHSFLPDLICAASSALILYVVAFQCPPRLFSLLNRPALVHLGRLSYAYYLFNAVILWSLVHLAKAGNLEFLLSGSASDWVQLLRAGTFMILAMILTLGLSEAMHRAVEYPSIALGRTLQQALLRRLKR